jgi:hypothetical protein
MKPQVDLGQRVDGLVDEVEVEGAPDQTRRVAPTDELGVDPVAGEATGGGGDDLLPQLGPHRLVEQRIGIAGAGGNVGLTSGGGDGRQREKGGDDQEEEPAAGGGRGTDRHGSLHRSVWPASLPAGVAVGARPDTPNERGGRRRG